MSEFQNPAWREDAQTNEVPHRMECRVFTDSSGHKLPYALLVPEPRPKAKLPLIVHLHGAGSWAADYPMPPGQALAMLKKGFPALVLAPKTDRPMMWANCDWTKTEHRQEETPLPSLRSVRELILHLLESGIAADGERVYLVGQSMGGFGVWDFVTRWRELVAAAVPICGGGDVETMRKIADLPVWIFHGDADEVVPVGNSRRLFAELQRLGSPARYTEYPGVGHAAWTPAYADEELFRWLFSQRTVKR